MSAIELNLEFTPVAQQKPAKISLHRQRFLLRRARLQQKAYLKKKVAGAPAQEGRPHPTGPPSQGPLCFSNGLPAGRGPHQVGRGSHEVGNRSHQASNGSHQAGKGSHQAGKGSHQAGKGSHQAGNKSHQASNGSHQAGKGSHQGAGGPTRRAARTPKPGHSPLPPPPPPNQSPLRPRTPCSSASARAPSCPWARGPPAATTAALPKATPLPAPPPRASRPPLKPYKCVAMDCEMVGTKEAGKRSELARCSIVSYHGDLIYDKYILPLNPITDYRTRWSGIRPCHMRNATPFKLAQREILKILSGKIVIGHAIHNDFKALKYTHPQSMTRDTSRMPALNKKAGFSEKGTVSLKRLTKALFDKDIQVGKKGHSSVEDARATMDLFRLVEAQVELEQVTDSTQK